MHFHFSFFNNQSFIVAFFARFYENIYIFRVHGSFVFFFSNLRSSELFRDFTRIFGDCNWTQTHNHLVHKWTLNHLVKLVGSVWLNDWVFGYILSGYGFESNCSHLNFKYCVCFQQRFPWHSGNYRVWIYSETCTWHDKNIQFEFSVLESVTVFYKVKFVDIQSFY